MRTNVDDAILSDCIETCKITWLNTYQVQGLLKNYTHSEIRKGKIKRWRFCPLDFIKMLDKKRQNWKRNLLK